MRLSSLTVCLLAALLLGCKSQDPRGVLPNDGSAWNHNYVIIHPTKPEVVHPSSKQVIYPACPCPQQPQVPATTVAPDPCAPVDVPAEGCGFEGGVGGDAICEDGFCMVDSPTDVMGVSPEAFGVSAGTASSGGDGLQPALIVAGVGASLAMVAWFAIGAGASLATLAAFLLLILAGGCVGLSPLASEESVAEVDERVGEAFDAQADTFNEHLATNPGDIEGATGAAFGAAVEQHKKKPAPAPDFPWLEVLGAALGVGGIGGAGLVRFLRGSPLKSGSADKLAE